MELATNRKVRSFIKQSNLIEGISDPKEIDQSLVAWEYLIEQSVLNHSVIRKVQKIITLNQKDLLPNQRGYYRDQSGIEVTVGGKYMPHSALVYELMGRWLTEYKLLGWLSAHIRFEGIHPFVDGNGRTGRMLMNWQRIRLEGLPLLIILDSKKHIYYKLFN